MNQVTSARAGKIGDSNKQWSNRKQQNLPLRTHTQATEKHREEKPTFPATLETAGN
jgi:hypothetical protein